VSELEQALVALGRDLELPASPDVTAAVRSRLTVRRPRRRLRLALAVALLLVAAVAAAFAVPQSRGALLRFLHIRGAEVTLVDRVPKLPYSGFPGARIRLVEAPRYLGRRPLLLDGQPPTEIFAEPGAVWLRYDDRGLLVAEVRTGDAAFLKKVAAGTTVTRYVVVGGEPGIWIGGPHLLELPAGTGRTAGPTLLWQHGDLTLRLEGARDLEQAQALALGFR